MVCIRFLQSVCGGSASIFYTALKRTYSLVSFATYPTAEFSHMDVTYQINAGGVHDEAVWKYYFPDFYKWVVGKMPAHVLEKESDLKIG